MSPQRWREIEDLYHAALEQEPAARVALLQHADPELRQEVEALLAQSGSLPGIDTEVKTGTNAAPIEQLGPYRIEGVLGAGGMGQVLRANDTRLHRTVAIKILPHDKVADPERKRRFLHEARAASALNHPNIVTVHDIASDNGIDYLVMEYVPGKSLDKLIGPGGLPMPEVIAYGTQIASALAVAHAAGIVHRDIKPANVIVTGEGQVKVLDFGLAKLEERRLGQDSETLTRESALTKAGMVMGTAAYMSPEQARGEEVDARTDLFSFGAVLYEMVTGRRAFQRSLDWTMPPAGALPPELAPIVTKLLNTDRAMRYESAAEVRAELERIKPGTASVRGVQPQKTRARIFACASVAAALAAGVFYLRLHRAPKLSTKDSIVLADISNGTGDPVFDETLRQGLSVQLEQSPSLILIPESRIRRTLGLMGQQQDAKLTPEIAEQLCQRVGSTAVLEGSIASLGSQYVLGILAKNCQTGEVLDEQQVQVARKEDVLGAVTSIASKLRLDAGESAEKVKENSTPLAEATTPYLNALRAYSTAWKVHDSGDSPAAVVLLKRAIEIDPKFAMAYAFLGQVYSDMDESALSAESLRKAYQLRDHASDRERLFIENHYQREVTGNLELAQRSGESWEQAYPRDRLPHVGLSMVYQEVGKYERSLEEGNAVIELDPDFPPGYNDAAWAYVFLGRLDEAEKVVQRAAARKLQAPDLLILPYYIAFLKKDQVGMQRAAEVGKENSAAEDWISDQEAVTLAYSGHLKQARALSRRAADLAQQNGQPERAAIFQAGSAVREAFFGNAAEARQSAVAALKNSKGRDIEYGAALALAFSGDLAQSDGLANDLERRFPEDTYVKFTYVPNLRALSSLNRGEPSKAIELLQPAIPYDLAIPGSCAGFYGNLYSVYVRGLSYLAAKQGQQAALEFQRILDHTAIVFSDPVGAVARVQIARAFAQSGGKTKALAAYRDFLDQWKDGDPEIPLLRQARAEYTRLQ